MRSHRLPEIGTPNFNLIAIPLFLLQGNLACIDAVSEGQGADATASDGKEDGSETSFDDDTAVSNQGPDAGDGENVDETNDNTGDEVNPTNEDTIVDQGSSEASDGGVVDAGDEADESEDEEPLINLDGQMPNSATFAVADFNADDYTTYDSISYYASKGRTVHDLAVEDYTPDDELTLTDFYMLVDKVLFPYDDAYIIAHLRNDTEQVRCRPRAFYNVSEDGTILLGSSVYARTGARGWTESSTVSAVNTCLPPGGSAVAYNPISSGDLVWPDDIDKVAFGVSVESYEGELAEVGSLAITSLEPDDSTWQISITNDGSWTTYPQEIWLWAFDNDGRLAGLKQIQYFATGGFLFPTQSTVEHIYLDLWASTETLVVQYTSSAF